MPSEIQSQIHTLVLIAKIACYVMIAVFGVIAAISGLYDGVGDKKESAAFKAWLGKLWEDIDRRHLHELPRLAVERSLRAFGRLVKYCLAVFTTDSKISTLLFGVSGGAIGGGGTLRIAHV